LLATGIDHGLVSLAQFHQLMAVSGGLGIAATCRTRPPADRAVAAAYACSTACGSCAAQLADAGHATRRGGDV